MSAAQSAFDHPKTPPQLGSDPVNTLIVVRLAKTVACYWRFWVIAFEDFILDWQEGWCKALNCFIQHS